MYDSYQFDNDGDFPSDVCMNYSCKSQATHAAISDLHNIQTDPDVNLENYLACYLNHDDFDINAMETYNYFHQV